jgi:hypothetical protein
LKLSFHIGVRLPLSPVSLLGQLGGGGPSAATSPSPILAMPPIIASPPLGGRVMPGLPAPLLLLLLPHPSPLGAQIWGRGSVLTDYQWKSCAPGGHTVVDMHLRASLRPATWWLVAAAVTPLWGGLQRASRC